MRVVSCFCPAGRRPRRSVRALCALLSRRLLRLWPRLSWPNIKRIRKLTSLRFHRPAAIWIFDRSALRFRSTSEQPIQSISEVSRKQIHHRRAAIRASGIQSFGHCNQSSQRILCPLRFCRRQPASHSLSATLQTGPRHRGVASLAHQLWLSGLPGFLWGPIMVGLRRFVERSGLWIADAGASGLWTAA